ncbi:MAG: transcription elongation factor GreA [Candidatus Bipolaricaulota bacterium]
MNNQQNTRILLTEEGYERLSEKVEHVQGKIQEKREDMKRTAKHGDLSENAGYMAAKESYEGHLNNLSELREVLNKARVIDNDNIENAKVGFGNYVTVEDLDEGTEHTYKIVGKYEARMEKGEISIDSPVAQGLLEKEKGDVAEIETPGGSSNYKILEISN